MGKKVLLDTNFVVSCVKNRIDFFEELRFQGYKLFVPTQVLRELKNLKEYSARVALQVLDNSEIKKINLEVNYVDEGIARFCEKNKEFILATLDEDLMDRVANPKMIIRNRKNLEVVHK